jgi:hypothetical protein
VSKLVPQRVVPVLIVEIKMKNVNIILSIGQ